MSIRLAIFDLDDTLYDQQHSAECGIRALQERFPPMAEAALEELAALYHHLLNRFHLDILAGRETVDSARPKRYRAFLEGAGVVATAGAGAHCLLRQQLSTRSAPREVDHQVAMRRDVGLQTQ